MSISGKFIIVVPCYNEALKWPHNSYDSFLSSCPEHLEFIFVNDGSTDKTGEIIENLSQKYPSKVSTLQMKKNSGKAEAVRQGVLLASTQSEYAYIGYWDADLATPLEEIDHLIKYVKEKDHPVMIMGSRVKILGTTNIQRDAMRHYLGRIVATMISIVLKLGIYDTQCGAKLIRGDQAKGLMSEGFLSRWLFDVELLFRIMKMNPSRTSSDIIIEVPLNTWQEKGDSKIPWSFAFKIPFELLNIAWKYR